MTSLKLTFLALATITSVLSDPAVVPLYKRSVPEYINTQYVGKMKLGEQNFEVVYDTSSSALVVPKASCVSGGCKCMNLHKFYPTDRTKIGSQQVELSLLDFGYAKGTVAHESIEISSLNATNQSFLLANDISFDICILGADGVVGMGRPGNSENGLTTVLETFTSEIYPGFSFHHARYPNGLHFGVLVIGGILERYYEGPITWVPLVDDKSWNVKVDSIKVGEEVVVTDTLAFIDSSKYIVVGPTDQINKINEQLGCTSQVNGEEPLCVFDCDKIDSVPSVTFNIGSFVMNINSEYHIQQSGDLCYSGFWAKDGLTTISLGDFVIDNYWQYFDPSNKRIGFAVSTEEL